MKDLPLVRKLGEKLELPGEALGELKLRIWGERLILMENHGPIQRWSEELLAVRCGAGNLLLFGRDLQIRAMDGDSLLLGGKLSRLEWKE